MKSLDSSLPTSQVSLSQTPMGTHNPLWWHDSTLQHSSVYFCLCPWHDHLWLNKQAGPRNIRVPSCTPIFLGLVFFLVWALTNFFGTYNIIQSLYWVSAEWKIANFLETKLVYQKTAHANTKVNCGTFILYFLFYHFLVFEPRCLHQQFRRYIFFCYLKVSLEKQQCFWCCNRESFTYIENLVIFL